MVFNRIGTFTLAHRGFVLITAAAALVLSVVIGGGIADRLSEGGFDDPGSDSVRAHAELESRFGAGPADLVALVTVDVSVGDVNTPSVIIDGVALTEELASFEGTAGVLSYWTTGDSSLHSLDAQRGLVIIRVPGESTDPVRREVIADLLAEYGEAERGPFTVQLGGRQAVFEEMGQVIEDDLALAELIAIPLTFIVLIIVFGGLVAAALPVGVGILAALGTFLVLHGVTAFTDVSIFALNLVTALGLGLAIDYSLLVVSRYREELKTSVDRDTALLTTIETSGHTIAFSGLTVAISLSALFIFPLTFLRSFAYAGIGVVLLAITISVVVLPAALSLLGARIDRFTVYRRRVGRHAANPWKNAAKRVIARPWPIVALTIPLLVIVALPFLGVVWGEADDRALPADDPVRAVSDILRDEFATAEANAFPIVALGAQEAGAATSLALKVSLLDGVTRVDAAAGTFVNGANVNPPGPAAERFTGNGAADDATWFNVVPSLEPISPEGEALIEQIRDLDSAYAEVLVGGGTAALLDTKNAIFDRAWLAAATIVVATFVLLFLMFKSILVPIKALALNTLSLGATFGMMVWIFQSGHGSGLLNFTPTGQTDITTPILMFCIAFGLSMDYEVFLLARMKEEYDRTGDNDAAIVAGLAHTGGLVTAAAVLLSITFLAFATSSVSTIKLFGLGLAVAVLVDAFVVRVTLVPALMTLAGKWNWWSPSLLGFGGNHAAPFASRRTPVDLRKQIDLTATVDVRDHDLTSH